MKQLITISVIMISCYTHTQSQNREAREKIQAARIALITERLELTPDQAEKFWPIYNEYNDKRKDLARQYKAEKDNLDMNTASEQEKKELLDLGLEIKEKSIALEKEYSDLLLEVISADQIIALRKAESDFRKMVLEQLQKRRNERQERRLRNNG